MGSWECVSKTETQAGHQRLQTCLCLCLLTVQLDAIVICLRVFQSCQFPLWQMVNPAIDGVKYIKYSSLHSILALQNLISLFQYRLRRCPVGPSFSFLGKSLVIWWMTFRAAPSRYWLQCCGIHWRFCRQSFLPLAQHLGSCWPSVFLCC